MRRVGLPVYAMTSNCATNAMPLHQRQMPVGADQREHGLRRAIGELLTCPFCLGTWIASGFIYGYIFAPRVTRSLASIFAVSGLADFLQQLYVKTQEMNE